MPAIAPTELIQVLSDAIYESGYVGQLTSSVREHPRRFIIEGNGAPPCIFIYAWTLTFGGRPSLANEYRIQMTSVLSPLLVSGDGPTVLIGYEPNLNLFAGFDLDRHRTFTTGSPSVQIDVTVLRQAESAGLSFHRKSNGEIAIGIRPDMFMAYVINASILHRFGRDTHALKSLTEAVNLPVQPQQIEGLPAERRRVITEVSRLTRDAAFRQRVMFAYGQRCAITRMQLRLVDAAHILPVGADGSSDAVQNGVALSPTYHRAFDAGLIYLTEEMEMKINPAKLGDLRQAGLAGGVEGFRKPLGRIFVPPDQAQHPSIDFIRRANRLRQISAV